MELKDLEHKSGVPGYADGFKIVEVDGRLRVVERTK